MKHIILLFSCLSISVSAHFSTIDIIQATLMSMHSGTNPYINLAAQKSQEGKVAPEYSPTLQKIGSVLSSPYTSTLGYALFVSAFTKKDATPGVNRIVSDRNYKKNIVQTVSGTGIGCIGTALIDRVLSKLGYKEDSHFVRPVTLFAGSIGSQLLGQALMARLMTEAPQARPHNNNYRQVPPGTAA